MERSWTPAASPLDEFLQEDGFDLSTQDQQILPTALPQQTPTNDSDQQDQQDDEDRSTIISHDTEVPFFFDTEFFESTLGREDQNDIPLKELFSNLKLFIQEHYDFLARCTIPQYGVRAQQSAQHILTLLPEVQELVERASIYLEKVKACLHSNNNDYQIAYTADREARKKIEQINRSLIQTFQWADMSYYYYRNKIKTNHIQQNQKYSLADILK